MAVRMTHPIHGATHANGAEINWNKVNGWVVDTATPETVPPVAVVAAPAVEAPAVVEVAPETVPEAESKTITLRKPANVI